MSSSSFDTNSAPDPLRRALHDHWRMYLVEGIVLVILGIGAIVLPLVAGLAVAIILGWLFLVGGIVGLAATVSSRGAPGFGWSLLSGIVAVAAGLVLLWNPLAGLVTLTYVLIAYFIADGIFIIALAVSHRRELVGRWEWLLFNGIIDLILATIIVSGLPGTLAWALGLLVGIDLGFGGIALIGIANAARRVDA
jgi:uncharacterized membrane protein HdeD (DUF308 family)